MLKTKMYRYFTHVNTQRYLDILDDLLFSYNNTRHRSIRMAPIKVGPYNKDMVCTCLYPMKLKWYGWKYDVSDQVCIAMQRRPFCKGYLSDWSEEIFEIATHLPTSPVMYKLRDLAGKLIKGRFNEPKVLKVTKSTESTLMSITY